MVYDPVKDEIFVAEKGAGAWMNDRRLRVSGRRDLLEMIFATGIPFGGRQELPRTLRELAALMPRTAGVRRWGSASLDLAYVAAGRFDGFWERGLHAWDVAAGSLLVREAGGFVGTIEGEGSPLDDRQHRRRQRQRLRDAAVGAARGLSVRVHGRFARATPGILLKTK